MGQTLIRLAEGWSVIDAKTFVLKLKEKTGPRPSRPRQTVRESAFS
jgi:hypothetical protein